MRKFMLVFGLIAGLTALMRCSDSFAQAAAPAAAAPAAVAPAAVAPAAEAPAAVPTEGAEKPKGGHNSDMGFITIITRAGWFGMMIWLLIFGCSIACFALVIDSFLNISEQKISPMSLVQDVNNAISQGDLAQAIEVCSNTNNPLARVLKSGFVNVQEGFEVVQDSVGVAADIESENLLSRISYLSVISNVTPMLGLIGTVQGMILAFFNLGTTESGAAQQSMLAVNISHGLWATAVGLSVSVIASIFFYYFKNKTMRIILNMEALTLDATKSLRNAVIVDEEANENA